MSYSKRLTVLAGLLLALLSFTVGLSTPDHQVFLPVVLKAPPPTPTPTQPSPPPEDDGLAYVNYYRNFAGVPPVTDDATLNDNCWQHARYMAENNIITHDQDPNLPYASLQGQICAQHGNVWLGSAFPTPIWEPSDSIDGWMSSVGHRLWLLYPTTPTFGYGFYSASDNRAGAALDVISRTNFAADQSYPDWPIRYPANHQTGVPTTKFPITLNWPYFGHTPSLTGASLGTEAGGSISHTADTNLPVGHKGVQILPSQNLPDNTVFIVSINGTYDNTPFTYSWKFSTGDAPIP
jgi:uncharacterized protein YkwD